MKALNVAIPDSLDQFLPRKIVVKVLLIDIPLTIVNRAEVCNKHKMFASKIRF